MNKGTIIMSSAGFLNPRVADFVKGKVKLLGEKKAAIITTAAKGKEKHKYSQLAKEQLLDIGVTQVDFFDLELDDVSKLEEYDMFYVCGGNTFTLLKFAQETNFKKLIEQLLQKGGLYFGVSAGSLIMGPSIKICSVISPDPNTVGLNNFNGLYFTNLVIFPHYEAKFEVEVRDFEKEENIKVARINNDEAILIENGETSVIK